MDCHDGIVDVDLAGKKMPQFYGLDGFPEVFYLLMDLFEKGLSSFLLKDIQGIFQVGESFINGVKR